MNSTTRLAIDVGGTFTDVVSLDTVTGTLRFEKVPTTPEAPTAGVLAAFEKSGSPIPSVSMLVHGTTLGLNALLTRTGARTALVSTRGFRDIYLLGRTDRKVSYDLKYRKRAALVQRSDTFEVAERMLFDGSVLHPLDEADARSVARKIAAGGYDAVAIALIHAYANPAHEQRLREIFAEEVPGVEVSLSHELSREYREYERTSTAVLDAYIKPVVRRYLGELDERLTAGGFEGRFFMTRSSGGAMTVDVAREQPVGLILSGPAGGVIGAAAISELIGRPDLVTIDMGGTSLDASLIVGGAPVVHHGTEFEGLPINTPSLYIDTIGSGGGSIAWIDDAGALQVGPQSAGAAPGPASYGRGGTAPTFTDAVLRLGYLGTDTPLGGTLTLQADLAEQALATVASRLSLSTAQLASGIMRISVTKIVGAVRAITVGLGHDPKGFGLLSLGGAGGLVAVAVARELGMRTVVIPPGQGAFCAFGMLMADVQHDVSRTYVATLSSLDRSGFETLLDQLESEASALLVRDGFPPAAHHLIRLVDVRYQGQEHTITVRLDDIDGLAEEFGVLHAKQFGHRMDDPIEVTAVRVRARAAVDRPTLSPPPPSTGEPEPIGQRRVYLSETEPDVEYRLYQRETLGVGDVLHGPAVIVEHTATTIMDRGDLATVGAVGEITIELDATEGKA